jgi:hypothetical protein
MDTYSSNLELRAAITLPFDLDGVPASIRRERGRYISEANVDPRHEAKFSNAFRRTPFDRLVAAANR